MSVDQFLNPPGGQKHWATGDWVCLVGKVVKSDTAMGASWIRLSGTDENSTVSFQLKGTSIAGVMPGMNVVVRGQVTSLHVDDLEDGSFVTQQQITEALASAERGAATGSK